MTPPTLTLPTLTLPASPLAAMFGSAAMEALFTPEAGLQAMLDVEAALARAEAKCGIIPKRAAAPIARACDAARYDLAALGQAARLAGNLAIPMVKALTAEVARRDSQAARYVHWGATSQDIIDTGLLLQLRQALLLIEADLAGLDRALAGLARRHKKTLMAGRTWLQQAAPIPFGLKLGGWLGAIRRDRARLRQIKPRLLVLQFGGAVGSLASLGDAGLKVSAALAKALQLGLPPQPWHGQRDRMVEIAGWLGLLTGNLAKMARDISLLMQTELGEVYEPAGAGKGGSSTMPHKRNPVGCAAVLAAHAQVPGLLAGLYGGMALEHERGLGGWQAEWQSLPMLCKLTAGALGQMREIAEGLEVDTRRMRRNLDITDGLIMAEAVSLGLARFIGKAAAHGIVEAASKQAVAQRRGLREVLAENPAVTRHLDKSALDRLFDPARYTGMSEAFIRRSLADKG